MPIGPTEMVVVLLIVLFVFGAGKLPEVGSALGKSIREFRAGFRDEPVPPACEGAKRQDGE